VAQILLIGPSKMQEERNKFKGFLCKNELELADLTILSLSTLQK
jgi:hypothetical protein